jgi:VWFA-related protein
MMTKIGAPRVRLRPALGAFLASALILAFAGPSSGGGAGRQVDQKNLEYEVTVALKLIQAYVTDNSGKAVTDLDKADFVLSVDGRPREITDFERHVLPPSKKKEAALAFTPAGPPSPLLGRKFVFLVDFALNDHLGLKRTAEAALRFLDEEVLPTDEVAVMTYSPFNGVVLHANLTTNHGWVRLVLQRIGRVTGYGSIGGVPLAGEGSGESLGAPGRGGGGREDLAPGFDFDREFVKKRTFDFALAMQELAKSLRYIPGFKNIIYFSSGIPRALLYDLEDARIRIEYDTMVKEFTSANCPVFSVNVEGQRAFLKEADERGDHALEILSERSGGRYFHDAAQDEKIAAEIQDMTGNYYVLGFRVGEAWDGKFHEVKVEVRREGCRVSSQGGYFSPQLFRKSTRFEKQLHLYDLALNDRPLSQAPLALPLVALPGPAGDGAELVLLGEIAVKGLDEVLGRSAEIVALVFDDENKLVWSRRAEVNRKSLEEPVYVPFALTPLPPGPYKCRLVLRNLDTGRAAVGAADIEVPAVSPDRLTLSAPMILVPGRPAFFLEVPGNGPKETDKAGGALAVVFPGTGGRAAPVVDTIERGITRLTVVARYSVPASRSGAPAFRAMLLDPSSGVRTPLPLEVVEVRNGKPLPLKPKTPSGEEIRVDTLVAGLRLPDLAPGSYTLLLEADDAGSGRTFATGRDITIR